MTSDDFWKLFAIITVITNTISILINGLEHWFSSFLSGCMFVLNLIGFIASFILTSEPINWSFLGESLKHAFSFWGVSIISFFLAIVIVIYTEHKDSRYYR